MGALRTFLVAAGIIKKIKPNPTTDNESTPNSQQQQFLRLRQSLQAEVKQDQNGYDDQDGENSLLSTTTTMLRKSAPIPSQRHKNKCRRMRQQLLPTGESYHILHESKRKRRSSTAPVAPHRRRQRNKNGPGPFYVAPIHGAADKVADTDSGYNGSNNNCSSDHVQPSTTAATIAEVVSNKRPRERDPDSSTTGSSEEQRPTRRRVLMVNNQLTNSAFLPITSISSVFTPVSPPTAPRLALNGIAPQASGPRRNARHPVHFKGLDACNDSDVAADFDPNVDVGTDADGPAIGSSTISRKHTSHVQDSSVRQEDKDENQDNSSGRNKVPRDEGQGHGDTHDGSQDSNDASQRDGDNGSDNNNDPKDEGDNDQDDENQNDENQDDEDENDDDQDDEDHDDEDHDDEDHDDEDQDDENQKEDEVENESEDDGEDESEDDDKNKNISADTDGSKSSTNARSPKDDKGKARRVSSPPPPSPISRYEFRDQDNSRTAQIKADEALARSLHQRWNRAIIDHPTAAHKLSTATSSIAASRVGSSSSINVTSRFDASSSSNVAPSSRTHQTPNAAGTFGFSTSNVAAVTSSSSSTSAPGYDSSHTTAIDSHATATGSHTLSNPLSGSRQNSFILATQARVSGSQCGSKQAHTSSSQPGRKQSHVVPLQIQTSAGPGASHVLMSQSSPQQSPPSGSSSESASGSGSPTPSLPSQSRLRDSYFTGFSDGHLHGYIEARRHACGGHTGLVALDLANLSGSSTVISHITTNALSAISPPQLHTLTADQLLDAVEHSWSEYDRLRAAARLEPSRQPPPHMYGFGIIPGQGFGYGEIIGPGLVQATPDFSRPYSAILLQGQNQAQRSTVPESVPTQTPIPAPLSTTPSPGPTPRSTGGSGG
ncbi:hypothetical protein BGZ50_007444, partial [Haplosporangium sp. Z 11]